MSLVMASRRVAKMVRIIRLCHKIVSAGDVRTCKSCPGVPPDVPEGHLAVYVGSGSESPRFIAPAAFINHSLFRPLLEKAEEEFGFTHNGPIHIPCKPPLFHRILSHISGISDDIRNSNIHKIIAEEMATDSAVSSDLGIPSY